MVFLVTFLYQFPVDAVIKAFAFMLLFCLFVSFVSCVSVVLVEGEGAISCQMFFFSFFKCKLLYYKETDWVVRVKML